MYHCLASPECGWQSLGQTSCVTRTVNSSLRARPNNPRRDPRSLSPVALSLEDGFAARLECLIRPGKAKNSRPREVVSLMGIAPSCWPPLNSAKRDGGWFLRAKRSGFDSFSISLFDLRKETRLRPHAMGCSIRTELRLRQRQRECHRRTSALPPAPTHPQDQHKTHWTHPHPSG